MRLSRAIALAALASASVQAQEQNHKRDDHQHHEHTAEASVPKDAPIKITINPEVRVSVSRGGDLPPPAACGRPIDLPVQIANQGFLTAPLEARLVEPAPEGLHVEFSADRLMGTREEQRMLRVTLKRPGPIDITIAFRAKNDISDLGGRDRIHLLLRCD
jgi:hypothetical protein